MANGDQGVNVERRGFLRILAWLGVGLLIGSGVGLFLGWVVWPAEFTDADPSIMEESYRQDYTIMIAALYSEDADLIAARRRLSNLSSDEPGRWVLSVTVDHILSREDETEIMFLVNLAGDMGVYSPIMEPYLPELELEQTP